MAIVRPTPTIVPPSSTISSLTPTKLKPKPSLVSEKTIEIKEINNIILNQFFLFSFIY